VSEGEEKAPEFSAFKRDYWVRDGVPVYTVPAAHAAIVLGKSVHAVGQIPEDKLPRRKTKDGKLVFRVRDVNEFLGIGDDLEWSEK
jgi:hypothetical protein